MKTHYDLLSVEPSADAETIKKAFRREIAKYHPDKVTHLGGEFQEMASTRAAELTAAYEILSDPEARAEYDEALRDSGGGGGAAAPARPRGEPAARAPEPPRADAEREAQPQQPSRRFEEDRAGKDDIVRRATLARLRQTMTVVLGNCDLPTVRGFDLAYVPRSKPVTSMTISQFFKRPLTPSVLVRIVPMVDAALASEAFHDAVRSRMGTRDKPLIVLLIGNKLAPAGELARAIEDARKKSPASLETIFPVPVDVRDWSAKIPLNAPPEIRSLIERLKSSV